jgi:DMSO/TMAO reductase YedYZ molybdopterin-dependent catalytic subunit/uncharacterized MnhB-related membrane protein
VAVLSFAFSVGVGHFIASFISPASSPYQAVADAAVRLAPSWAVELGKGLVLPGLPAGRADKVGLLVGVGVVLVIVAIVAGFASRTSSNPGRAIVLGIGVIGLLAALSSPVFTVPDVAAPMAAIGSGLWAFGWLHDRAMIHAVHSALPTDGDLESGPGDPAHGVTRRRLFVSSSTIGFGAVFSGLVGTLLAPQPDTVTDAFGGAAPIRPTSPAKPLPAVADFAHRGSPTFLTSNRDFYRIDTALRVPVLDADQWSLRLHGMVDRELTFSYAELLSRPLIERPVTLTCVSNEVGGNLISTANFIGVSLREVLLEAGVHRDADQLFSTSVDGFTCGTPTSVVLEPDRDAMLALGMNGEHLPIEHGFPVRMVLPGLYGFVSATKWLVDLELTTFDAKQSYWLQRGWAQQAPIKTQSRIDRPSSGARVPAGRITFAGIAWAQHRGIVGVEVSLDNGPWKTAGLSTEVTTDTWRMWVIDLDVLPGTHRVTCRATDTSGVTQTAVPTAVIPNGASGWPHIDFVAT